MQLVRQLGRRLMIAVLPTQIAESGLKLHAFDDFDEAAMKVIELSKRK